jgi:hypothetical protein
VDVSPLTTCLGGTPIYYSRPGISALCYKTVAPSEPGLPSAYKDAYQGPCVLVRLGPPYKPNGTIYENGDIKGPPSYIAQVLLDGVAKTATSCSSSSNGGFTAEMESSSFSRNAKIRINLASNVSYSFNVLVPMNLANDGFNLFASCVYSPTGCGSPQQKANANVFHYIPENYGSVSTIEGSPSKENIFYFKNPYIEYALTKDFSSGSSCAYGQCAVKRGSYSVKLANVDALIFPDKEIRPSN